jgi:hypothetical protein
MGRIMNKFREPWLFVFFEVLMKVWLEILGPERLHLEVCICPFDSSFQNIDEF